MKLDSSVAAVVTGGASGLGAATARALASFGVKVALFDFNEEVAKALAGTAYGPYAVDGEHTAPSNAAFDASLKSRDPRWGVRDVADVAACAREHGLLLEERVPMPANNFSLVFRRV